MSNKIENLLRKALLQNGSMERGLYEYELEEHIDYWYEGLKVDRDNFVFVVTENSGHVAMLVIMPDKAVYINEEAGTKLLEVWPSIYTANMKRLIPRMVDQLANGIIYVAGVKEATNSPSTWVIGRAHRKFF